MRVLLLGASGFIGRELFVSLGGCGHRVVAAVRDARRAPPFSGEPPLVVDLNRDTSAETWMPRLAGIEAVVNCAGILRGSREQSITAIHRDAPIALFEACKRAGVRRVVQISAISATRQAATEYALTKLSADEHLRGMDLDWVVLRPSLVIAHGAFGGTALLRGMAALPFVIPVPDGGRQAFQPIHVEDLARVVALALEGDSLVGKTVDPVGPQVVTLREIVSDYRRWLGFGEASIVPVPAGLVGAVCVCGDLLGAPVNSTSMAQLRHGNTGNHEEFARVTGISPRSWREVLVAQPAHAQDRWHARLYFVRPLLRYALALLWILSGVMGLLELRDWAVLITSRLSIGIGTALAALGAACLFDFFVAALLLRRWHPSRTAMIQVAAILGYTAAATAMWPSLWTEPLGPVFKNIPILAAVLALGAIEEDR